MEQQRAQIFDDIHLFELVVQASPAGMILCDGQGMIVYCNPMAQRWLGFEEDELIGRPIDCLVPNQYRGNHAAHREGYMAEPRARCMADGRGLYALRKDGSQLPVDISLHPVETSQGRMVLANILDATQRRKAESVPQERLAAIGEMVTGLAHESRNALQRARGCLDLLELDLEEQAEQLDLTQRIRNSLDDIQRNYEEVRNYAAPINLEHEVVDISQLLRETHEDLEYQFRKHQVSFELDAAVDASTNRVDRHRIKQIFRNVMENALQASPAGSSIVAKVCTRERDGELWQVVQIVDQGPGIAEDVVARMFDPFYTTKQTGTGLGLAICQRIVDAHHGKISAHQPTGPGATITLELPVNV